MSRDCLDGSVVADKRQLAQPAVQAPVEAFLRRPQQARLRLSRLGQRAPHEVQAERVELAERAHLPGVSPFHRAIHRRDVVRQLGGLLDRVHSNGEQQLAQEFGVAPAGGRQPLQALGERQLLEEGQLGKARLDLRAVLERLPVQREDRLLLAGVEPRSGLLPQPTRRDQRTDPRGEREVLASRGARPCGHMREHVDPRDVTRPERRRLGATDEGTGEGIDFVDREVELLHQPQHLHHAEDAEAIGDEARHVLGDDHPLAEESLRELAHRREHGGRGVGRRNQLEQVQITRRIEEVRPEKVALERIAASLRQELYRDPRRIRRDDCLGAANRFQPLVQRALRLRLLDDCLDDPIAVGEEIEMIGRVPGGDERGARRLHEWRRLGLECALDRPARYAVAIGLARHVQQYYRNPGRRGECGDAASHRSCPNHADLGNAHLRFTYGVCG